MNDRRRMDDEEIARIAEAAARAVQQLNPFGRIDQKQHEIDHLFVQRLEGLFDRIENTNWKVFQAVLIVLAGTSVIWLLFRLGVDVRKWKP